MKKLKFLSLILIFCCIFSYSTFVQAETTAKDQIAYLTGEQDATLSLNNEQIKISLGKSSTLKATRTPADKKDIVSWYSDDESIATVSAKGSVKAIGVGTTRIYAVTESGLEASCEVTVFAPIKTLKLSTTKASMVVGGNDLELSVTATPYDHTDSISWLSSDENIVTVENGIVTAHNQGKAKITVISGSGKKTTCTITVGVPADAVEFSKLKSTSLAVGKTLTLKAKAFRLDGEKPVSTKVRYEIVDDEGIVTLDAKGKLKALETGIVTVRAYPEACLEEVYDEVTINVCIPATKVVLNYKSYSMVVDDTLDLDATLSPENHSDTHTWSVDKPDIATVDGDGVVTALKAGKVKITATTGSGKKATCSITIGAPADTVKFSTLKTTSLAVGKTLTVTAKASCEDGSKPVSTAVVYEIIEGNNIATIDSKGKIKATGTGEVVIRATAQAGTETAYEEITISICNPITSIKFANSSISIPTNALTTNIFPTVSPANHTDTIKFTSSNTSVAIIDDFGNLTPVSKGTAKITATSGSGKKATCTVKVESPYITLSELTLHDVSYTYVEGDSIIDHNPGAVGGMHIHATAVAPSNLFEVRIAMWDTDISRMSLKEIQETAEWYADMWKETWETPSYTIDFPLEINTTHPVDPDEVGKDLQVLLIGLDKNCNAVGYYILENDGYVEGGNDDDNNNDDSLDMIITESDITANGKHITAYMVVDGLKQSYLSNKTETPNDHIEYEWSIEFSDGTNNYGVGITHWKNKNADKNIYMTLHDMQCDLWYNENPYSSSVVFTDVSLTIQGNRITFEFTIPDDYDFDSSKLTQGRTIATYYLY